MDGSRVDGAVGQGEVLVVGDFGHFEQGILRKAFDQAGIAYSDVPSDRTQVAVVWDPSMELDSRAAVPPGLTARTVNATGFDSTKRNIAEHFERVFGYSLAVDPTTFEGPMVCKSDANAVHDGAVVTGPLAPVDVAGGDRVYERFADNGFGPSVVDLRVRVVGSVRDLCAVKLRPVDDRFSNVNSVAVLVPTATVLAEDEVCQLDELVVSLGFEYGELDVLRGRGRAVASTW